LLVVEVADQTTVVAVELVVIEHLFQVNKNYT
jgi:hypothetical protein